MEDICLLADLTIVTNTRIHVRAGRNEDAGIETRTSAGARRCAPVRPPPRLGLALEMTPPIHIANDGVAAHVSIPPVPADVIFNHVLIFCVSIHPPVRSQIPHSPSPLQHPTSTSVFFCFFHVVILFHVDVGDRDSIRWVRERGQVGRRGGIELLAARRDSTTCVC